MFQNLKFRRRLRSIGTTIETVYLLYLNNQEAIQFKSQKDCLDYVKQFREENEIFKIQIYRIETYSL